MIEFKQIIGRGTRIREDHGKLYFTIIDFRNVTKLFADKDFDGDPIVVKPITGGEIPPEEDDPDDGDGGDGETGGGLPGGGYDDPTIVGGGVINDPPAKYYVNDVEVKVLNHRVYYYDKDGKLINESLIDYTKKNVKNEYHSLNEFLQKWNNADKKDAILKELESQGILLDELQDEVGKDLDPFDLICHVAFDMPPLTRQERANNVFLKVFDAKELEWELMRDEYVQVVPTGLRWSDWAANDEGMTGDELLEFINNILFKELKEMVLDEYSDPKAFIVKAVFEDSYNYMKSGTLIRQVINKLNEINFSAQEDRHTFNDIYEIILKDLQNAGNAGEYYTPRPITQFVVDMVNPVLGEKVLDFACGTGGYLTSTINHFIKTGCVFWPHPDSDSGNIRTAFRNYPDSITAHPDTLSSY